MPFPSLVPEVEPALDPGGAATASRTRTSTCFRSPRPEPAPSPVPSGPAFSGRAAPVNAASDAKATQIQEFA